MTAARIWTKIKDTAFAGRDSDWRSTYLDPVAARVEETALILYAQNQFVAEVLGSVRTTIRENLPSPVSEVIIRLGAPSEYAPRAAKASEVPPVTNDSTAVAKQESRAVRRGRTYTDPSTHALQSVWPRNQRGMPADLLRSSLFTVNRYGVDAARPKRDGRMLHSASSYELRVTGEETNIFDADVFAQLLHYQRNQPFGSLIWFSMREICIDLDLSPNGINITRVRNAIERMRDTKIDLRHHDGEKKRDFVGQLIPSFVHEEDSTQDRWCVEMSKQLVYLLGPGIQARYQIEVDRRLKSSLARYLLRFYSTHSGPIYPMKVETLRRFCGTTQVMKEFRRTLRAALKELKEEGFLEDWYIEDDKVFVTRKATIKPLALDQDPV